MTPDQTTLLNTLRQARQTKPDWYRWRLTNNYERAAFPKGDVVHIRETNRYRWAAQNLLGKKVLDLDTLEPAASAIDTGTAMGSATEV